MSHDDDHDDADYNKRINDLDAFLVLQGATLVFFMVGAHPHTKAHPHTYARTDTVTYFVVSPRREMNVIVPTFDNRVVSVGRLCVCSWLHARQWVRVNVCVRGPLCTCILVLLVLSGRPTTQLMNTASGIHHARNGQHQCAELTHKHGNDFDQKHDGYYTRCSDLVVCR